MAEGLINRYRPNSFDEVLGQDAAVKALKRAIAERSAHTFLFTGPAGCGKTTLARLTAIGLGCHPADLDDFDAASHSGVDDIRGILDNLGFLPLGEGSIKAVVVDECHSLSKQAWQALLKSTEEPPAHVFWMLCTTEPSKVPTTIVTRSLRIDVKPVKAALLTELLDNVATEEGLSLSDEVIDLCVDESGGSPRQALSNLAAVAGVGAVAEAEELLSTAAKAPEAYELARLLMKRPAWSEVQDLLNGFDSTINAESIRQVVRAYATKVALNSNAKQAEWACEVLEAFSSYFNSHDGISPVVVACSKLVLT